MPTLFELATTKLYYAGWLNGENVDHLVSLPELVERRVQDVVKRCVPDFIRGKRLVRQELVEGQTILTYHRVTEHRLGCHVLLSRTVRPQQKRFCCQKCRRTNFPTSPKNRSLCSYCGSRIAKHLLCGQVYEIREREEARLDALRATLFLANQWQWPTKLVAPTIQEDRLLFPESEEPETDENCSLRRFLSRLATS